MTTQQLEAELSGISNLPIMPKVAICLLELLNDPGTSVRDINDVMSKDPSLAATILKIVNSSYYGLRHNVSSLTHALSLLGYRTVKNVVLTAAASGLFRVRSATPCFDSPAFSLHSVASAAVARYLANYSGVVEPETAYSLGLLHDIGKLALDQCFPKPYFSAVMSARRQGHATWEAEREVCGYTHADVGEALARIWKLPEVLSSAIGLHHGPSAMVDDDLIAIAHVSDYACAVKDYRAPDCFVSVELNPNAWRRLNLHVDVLPHLFSALDEEIDKARQMFATAAP